MQTPIVKVRSTSFEINKLITSTQLFSNIKLTVSARLVLRCIVDFWNFKLCCSYPTQLTIAKCTGLSDVAVGKAIKELHFKGLVDKNKKNKRIYYRLTLKLLGYLNLTPKVIYVGTQKTLYDTPQCNLDKNILKEKENISYSTSSEKDEQNARLAFAKAMIKCFGNNPRYARKVAKLKEKYGL